MTHGKTRMFLGGMLLAALGGAASALAEDCIDNRIDNEREIVAEYIGVLENQVAQAEDDVERLEALSARSRSANIKNALRRAQINLARVQRSAHEAEQQLSELDSFSVAHKQFTVEDVGAPRDGGDDPCVMQCNFLYENCTQRAISEYDDYDTALLRSSRQAVEHGCTGLFPFLVTGECGDGMQFIYSGGGFTANAKYYHPAGEFAAETFVTDVPLESCGTITYWPEHVTCAGAVVTEVFCGTLFEVGEEVCMP